jgi:NAD(P)-dependent dehydrogenase (short-subunit alcohol dehydrogenase family)
MFSLQGKITIVTGAGSGIGTAIADSFVRCGATVYAADCDERAVEAAAASIAADGGRIIPVRTDISDPGACRELIGRVLGENAGRCDVLVNNAGVGHVGTILTTSPDDLDRLWRVNVLGAYFLSREVLPAMIERKSGSIINIASIAGLTGMESRLAYVVSKHALVGMTRAMAMDHGTSGVRINAICPGRVKTPFVDARLREYANPDDYLRQMEAPHALKRMAQPSEIAAAAVFLASDESAFVTGSAMVVDGGYTAGK